MLQRLHQPSHPFPSTFPSTSLAPSPPLPSSSTSTSAQLFLAQQGVNIGQQQAYLSSLALSTPPPPSSSSPPATSLLAFLQQRHSSLVNELRHDSVTADTSRKLACTHSWTASPTTATLIELHRTAGSSQSRAHGSAHALTSRTCGAAAGEEA